METISIDQLLQQMASEFGSEPETMKLLSQLRPEGVFEHARNKAFAMGDGAIPQKYKLLMAIGISAAIGSSGCTSTYSRVAANKGIASDEIMESILLARFVSATAVVNAAGEAMKHLLDRQAREPARGGA